MATLMPSWLTAGMYSGYRFRVLEGFGPHLRDPCREPVTSLKLLSSSTYLAAGMEDGIVLFWDVFSKAVVHKVTVGAPIRSMSRVLRSRVPHNLTKKLQRQANKLHVKPLEKYLSRAGDVIYGYQGGSHDSAPDEEWNDLWGDPLGTKARIRELRQRLETTENMLQKSVVMNRGLMEFFKKRVLRRDLKLPRGYGENSASPPQAQQAAASTGPRGMQGLSFVRIEDSPPPKEAGIVRDRASRERAANRYYGTATRAAGTTTFAELPANSIDESPPDVSPTDHGAFTPLPNTSQESGNDITADDEPGDDFQLSSEETTVNVDGNTPQPSRIASTSQIRANRAVADALGSDTSEVSEDVVPTFTRLSKRRKVDSDTSTPGGTGVQEWEIKSAGEETSSDPKAPQSASWVVEDQGDDGIPDRGRKRRYRGSKS